MPSENNTPSGPATPVALHQGTNPVPNPSQPTRRLIRLSSPERQRLSSLHLTPDPEMEPPPKPPRSCSTLAHQALEASFKGWGMPVQSPQGSCWLRVGMACQGTFKSLLQHHSLKVSVLWLSAFFIVWLSHLYMTTAKTMT